MSPGSRRSAGRCGGASCVSHQRCWRGPPSGSGRRARWVVGGDCRTAANERRPDDARRWSGTAAHRPLIEQGLVEPLDLAVGLGSVAARPLSRIPRPAAVSVKTTESAYALALSVRTRWMVTPCSAKNPAASTRNRAQVRPVSSGKSWLKPPGNGRRRPSEHRHSRCPDPALPEPGRGCGGRPHRGCGPAS